MRPVFDLIVVGGGPAGTTLAVLVKKYNPGKRVLIIERDVFPRHHIGESTLPGMLPILEEMGVFKKIEKAGFLKKIGAFYARRGQKPWGVPFKNEKWTGVGRQPPQFAYSWQVHRAVYDKILLDHARECGVEVWECCAVSKLSLPSRMGQVVKICVTDRTTGSNQWLEGGLLADCSGQDGILSRYMGIRSHFQKLSNLAVYGYYQCDPFDHALSGTPEESYIVLRYVQDGWLWYIPLSKGLVSVGFVCNRKTLKDELRGDLAGFFEKRLRQSLPIWKVLKNARRLRNMDGTGKELFVVRDYSFLNRLACGPGWIAAGDAAYFVDPIISSGVFMAHMTGMRAAYTINTLWNSKDAHFRNLAWNDYNLFVQQLSSAFIRMALFWYSKKHSASQWCRMACKLTLGNPTVAISQLRAFVHLTSGLFPYRTSILEDPIYWTNARMTLAMLANDRQWRLEKSDPIPLNGQWRPRFRCRFELVQSTAMDIGKGILLPSLKVRFKEIGRRADISLQPTVAVTGLHLQILDGIKKRRSVAELIIASSQMLGVTDNISKVFVRQFLQELHSAGYLY